MATVGAHLGTLVPPLRCHDPALGWKTRPMDEATPPGVGATEEVLLARRAAAGDERALGEVYDRYGTACYRVALRVTSSPSLAEEVVQETFLSLWRNAGYSEQAGSLRAYLVGAAHHKAVDAVRRESSLARRSSDYGRREAVLAGRAEAPEDALLAGLQAGEVRAALEELAEPQRQAIALAYYGGHTQREIAEMTGVPIGTVKTRMFAGMGRLRARLAPTSEPEATR